MTNIHPAAAAGAVLAAALLSASASAQDAGVRGIYGVARAGVSVNPDEKLRTETVESRFEDKNKFKPGFTGELGGGYNFGLFRLEQTIGYTQIKPKNDTELDGRTKAFTLAVSCFVDIPTGTIFTPYIGGGAGVARVDARSSGPIAGVATAYSGKDYGLLWHGSAGVGIAVAPRTTLEVGGRYQQISGLKFDGTADGASATFKPKMRTVSGTVGLRYAF